MGWLDALELGLGAANAAANYRTAATLDELKKQNLAAAQAQAILLELRNTIYTFKQRADRVLMVEVENPRAAAGAMAILADRLEKTKILPEIFPDISDKEYTGATIRLIQENSKRIRNSLSRDDKILIDQVVNAVQWAPEYDYYINNFENAGLLVEALKIDNKLSLRNSGCVWFLILCSVCFGFLMLAIGGLIILFAGSSMTNYLWAIGFLGIGLVCTIGIPIAAIVGMRIPEYSKAHSTVTSLEKVVNLKRFNDLDAKIGGKEKAIDLRQTAQKVIETVFAESRALFEP